MRNTADEWRHPHFVRGQPKLLENIVRKAHDGEVAAPPLSEPLFEGIGSDERSRDSDKAPAKFGADAPAASSKRPAPAIVESKSVPVSVKADPVVHPAPAAGPRPASQVADRDAFLNSSAPLPGYIAMSRPESSLHHHATEASYPHADLEPRRAVGGPYGMYSREEEIMLQRRAQRRLAAVSSSAHLPPPPSYNHYDVPPSYAAARGMEPPETLNYPQHHQQASLHQNYSLGDDGIVRQLRRLNEIRDDLLRKICSDSQGMMVGGSYPGAGARVDHPSGQVGQRVEVPTVLHPPHLGNDAFRETDLFRSTSGPAKKRFKGSPSMLPDLPGRPPRYAPFQPTTAEVPWPRNQHGIGMGEFERHVPFPPTVTAAMLSQQSKSNKPPKSTTEELECAAILSGLGQEKSESTERTNLFRKIS